MGPWWAGGEGGTSDWLVVSWEAPGPEDPSLLHSCSLPPIPGKVAMLPERKIGLFSFLALSKASCPQGYLGPAQLGIIH